MFQPNEQQLAVFHWAKTGTGSLNLIARAGCGKTSTLVELSQRITGRAFLGAFNKAIASELKARITSPNVEASTMHSLGFRLWRKMRPNTELDERKVYTLARDKFPYDKKALGVLLDAVGYAKQAGLGLEGKPYRDEALWTGIFDYYDLWDDMPSMVSPTRIIESCIQVYVTSLEMCDRAKSVIDFSDMILAPLLFSQGKLDWMQTFDWVMIDEAQDTNETRRQLAIAVLKKGGRLVAVGDPAQAIYGFAGANNDSMELIKAQMNCVELPLSVTYRCPKTIVELAQTWVPDITAHETAPQGEVEHISHLQFWLQDLHRSDAILCRNTRPLLGIAKRLRKAGIRCMVEGASGKGLISLAGKWGNITITEFLEKLAEYQETEYGRYKAKENEAKAEAVLERCSILRDMAERLDDLDTTDDLVKKIEWEFCGNLRDNENVLKLCTVHRSKGREWDRVFLIGRNRYMPSVWASQEWELEQETNLMYVAVTRVKKVLVEVDVPVPPRGQREEMDWWEL